VLVANQDAAVDEAVVASRLDEAQVVIALAAGNDDRTRPQMTRDGHQIRDACNG
jgi:hypothetical protein